VPHHHDPKVVSRRRHDGSVRLGKSKRTNNDDEDGGTRECIMLEDTLFSSDV
jgi:hypothetical protein